MKIDENLQKSLILANNTTAVTDLTFKKLLENCFAVLKSAPEPHNITSLYNSKPDLIKELYAALLSATVQFVRTGQDRAGVAQFLGDRCNFSGAKLGLYGDLYEKNRRDIEAELINIGGHLPHVTDVSWKIDYVIKSSNLDKSGGPLFRIGLQTEKFDPEIGAKKIEFVNFSCTSVELQDLVYKLKDAVRHCQRIGNEH